MGRYYLSREILGSRLAKSVVSGSSVANSQSISAGYNGNWLAFRTEPWVPGNANSWAGYSASVTMNITSGSTSLFGMAIFYRNGVQIGQSAEVALSAGAKTMSVASLSAGGTPGDGKGDYFSVELYIRSSSSMAITIAWTYETTAAYIDTTIPEFATAQPAIIRPNAQYKADYTPVPTNSATGTAGNTTPLILEADILAKLNGNDLIMQAEDDAVGVSFANTADRTSRTRKPRYAELPTARRGAVLTYDSVNDRYISCGGYDGSSRFSDLWALDMSRGIGQWEKLATTGTAPAGKNLGAAVQLNGDNGKSWFFYWGGSTGSDNNALSIANCTDPTVNTVWTPVTQTSAPAVRSYITHHLVAVKTGANTFDVYLFGGWGSARYNDIAKVSLNLASAVPTALTWTTLKANGTAGNPTIRSGAMCFWDEVNNRIVIVGGYSGTAYLNDVWAYSIAGNSFSQLSPTGTAPDARELPSGGYDPTSQKLVFFGGWRGSATTNKNDIVQLDFSSDINGAWTTLRANDTTNQDHYAFSSGAACYDSKRRIIVEFGQNGYDATDKYVYAYSFTKGTDHLWGLNVQDDFRARDAPSMVYNSTRGEYVLMCGYSNMTNDEVNASATNGDHMNEVWAYNATDDEWRYASQGYLGMTYKEGTVAVYDDVNDRILVFGGLVGANEWINETWELKADAFGNYEARLLAPTGTKPGVRWLAAAAWDNARNRMIITQGSALAMTNDVWALDFSGGGDGAWTQLTPTGSITGVTQPGFVNVPSEKRLYLSAGSTANGLGTFTTQIAYLDYTNANPAWTVVAASPTGLTPGRGSALWYNTLRGTLWTVGGFTSSIQSAGGFFKIGSNTNWSALGSLTNGGRRSMGYATDTTNNRTVITGGRPDTGMWFRETLEKQYTSPTLLEGDDALPGIVTYSVYTRWKVEVTGRSDGSYHWQANATLGGDQADWASYGGNAESSADFIVGAGSGGSNFTSTRTDTATATDAATKAAGKLPTDTATTSDSPSKKPTKAAADSATASDSQTQSIGRRTLPTDSVTATDAATRATGKRPADAAVVSDASTRSTARPVSDSVTPSDNIAAVLQRKLSFADSVTVTDGQITVTGKAATFGDAVAAADAVAKAVADLEADSLTASDSATRREVLGKSDSVTTSDASTRREVLGKADTATATDSNTRAWGFGRFVADTVQVFEAFAKAITAPRGADSATASDSASLAAGRTLSRSDSATASDASSRRATTTKSDSATATDAATQSAGRNLSRTDSVTPVDQNSKTFATTNADTAATTDSPSKKPGRAAADSVTASDNLTTAMNRFRSFADSITASDSSTRRTLRAVVDAITANDSVIYGIGRYISTTDEVTSSDAVSKQGEPQPTDSVSTSDSESHFQGHGRVPSDTLIAEDAIYKALTKQREDQAFAVDNQGAAGVARTMSAEDVVSVAEAQIKAITQARSDSATATDSQFAAAARYQTASDSATAADDSYRTPGKQPVDAVFVTDAPAIVKAFIRAFADVVTSTDTSTRRPVKANADTIATTDANTNVVRKAASDVVSAADAAIRSLQKVAADAVTVVEQQNTNGQSNWYQNVDDVVLAIDTTFKRYAKAQADTATATDAVLKVAKKYPTDSATATDAQTKNIQAPKSDSATVTDNSGSRFVKKPAADSVSTSDTNRESVTLGRSDLVTALDNQAKRVYRQAADAVTAIDAILGAGALFYYANDNVVSDDQIAKALLITRSDGLTAEDQAIARNTITLLRADTAFINELASRAVTHPTTDSFAAIDDANVLAAKGIIVADAVAAADEAYRRIIKRQQDSQTVTDILTKAITFYIADQYGIADMSVRQTRKLLQDGAVVADAITKVISMTRRDTVQVTDEALEDAARIVTGNIIAISARQNNVRGMPVRGSGYRQ